MTLRLRNTLTRRVEPIDPIEPGRVRMYTCGPTVYRYAHVGNLRSYLLADFIRRTLLYHGLDVVHVKNITDVGHLRDERFDRGEDRMLVAAGLEDRTPAEIAAAYEAAFHADEAAVNILPAHVFPRATEHVSEMVELAERLEDMGSAYVSDESNVYFAVGSFPAYGRLSGNTVDELRAGHRGATEPDKRDVADFALWKAAGEGRILKWPTRRWGEGYPGWHLECSAMALRYLGEEFDVHTGGIDNVFPHHEDEIAQSASVTGRVPARHWVHGEHLLMAGRKMAKSAGNFVRVTELADQGIEPLAFRYLVMTARYGRKLNLSDASLAAAQAALRSLRSAVASLASATSEPSWPAPQSLRAGAAPDRPDGQASGPAGHGDPNAAFRLADRAHAPGAPLSPAGTAFHERFVAALDDDLDLPRALAVVREIARSDLSADERRWLVLDADLVLGLDLDLVIDGAPDRDDRRERSAADAEGGDEDGVPAVPDDIRELVQARADARASKRWADADVVRAELGARGWELEDRPDGTTVTRRSRDRAGARSGR